MKTEYHKPYFDTIHLLLGLNKEVEQSFIAEHMLFSIEVVKQMISEIEQNHALPGRDFAEKVLRAAADIGYDKMAFSEFETYGTYVCHKYPDLYVLEKWNSLRRGSKYFEKEQLDRSLMEWLGRYYDAVSFEKCHKRLPLQSKIIGQKWIRRIVSARTFEKIHEGYCFVVRVRKKIFKK